MDSRLGDARVDAVDGHDVLVVGVAREPGEGGARRRHATHLQVRRRQVQICRASHTAMRHKNLGSDDPLNQEESLFKVRIISVLIFAKAKWI